MSRLTSLLESTASILGRSPPKRRRRASRSPLKVCTYSASDNDSDSDDGEPGNSEPGRRAARVKCCRCTLGCTGFNGKGHSVRCDELNPEHSNSGELKAVGKRQRGRLSATAAPSTKRVRTDAAGREATIHKQVVKARRRLVASDSSTVEERCDAGHIVARTSTGKFPAICNHPRCSAPVFTAKDRAGRRGTHQRNKGVRQARSRKHARRTRTRLASVPKVAEEFHLSPGSVYSMAGRARYDADHNPLPISGDDTTTFGIVLRFGTPDPSKDNVADSWIPAPPKGSLFLQNGLVYTPDAVSEKLQTKLLKLFQKFDDIDEAVITARTRNATGSSLRLHCYKPETKPGLSEVYFTTNAFRETKSGMWPQSHNSTHINAKAVELHVENVPELCQLIQELKDNPSFQVIRRKRLYLLQMIKLRPTVGQSGRGYHKDLVLNAGEVICGLTLSAPRLMRMRITGARAARAPTYPPCPTPPHWRIIAIAANEQNLMNENSTSFISAATKRVDGRSPPTDRRAVEPAAPRRELREAGCVYMVQPPGGGPREPRLWNGSAFAPKVAKQYCEWWAGVLEPAETQKVCIGSAGLSVLCQHAVCLSPRLRAWQVSVRARARPLCMGLRAAVRPAAGERPRAAPTQQRSA